MYKKDPTEWRKGFRWWKETGKSPWKAGKRLSDEEYISIMEKVAADNWQKWGDESEDAALTRILNSNIYDYRGYYNENPKSAANADTHWPDEYKTVYHPTFSNLSKYSSKKSKYNPNGLPGGTWNGEFFNPLWYQLNPHGPGFYKDGYPRLPKFENGTEPTRVGDYNVYPSAIGASELNVTTPEVVITGEDRRPAYLRYDAYNSSYDPKAVAEGFNALTLGGLNNLSPTQWLRRVYDLNPLVSGKMSGTDYMNNWIYGNNGVTSDEYAEKHPIRSTAINTVLDAIAIGAKGFKDFKRGKGIKLADTKEKNLVRYEYYDEGNPVGDINFTTFDNHPHITWVGSAKPGSGYKLYDAAIQHALDHNMPGIFSGESLESAPKTYSMWRHYPNKTLVGKYGVHNNVNMASPKSPFRDFVTKEEAMKLWKENQFASYKNGDVWLLLAPRNPVEWYRPLIHWNEVFSPKFNTINTIYKHAE